MFWSKVLTLPGPTGGGVPSSQSQDAYFHCIVSRTADTQLSVLTDIIKTVPIVTMGGGVNETQSQWYQGRFLTLAGPKKVYPASILSRIFLTVFSRCKVASLCLSTPQVSIPIEVIWPGY